MLAIKEYLKSINFNQVDKSSHIYTFSHVELNARVQFFYLADNVWLLNNKAISLETRADANKVRAYIEKKYAMVLELYSKYAATLEELQKEKARSALLAQRYNSLYYAPNGPGYHEAATHFATTQLQKTNQLT